MKLCIAILCAISTCSLCVEEGKKWSWGKNARARGDGDRYRPSNDQLSRDPRYETNEYDGGIHDRVPNGFRPPDEYRGTGFPYNNRPIPNRPYADFGPVGLGPGNTFQGGPFGPVGPYGPVPVGPPGRPLGPVGPFGGPNGPVGPNGPTGHNGVGYGGLGVLTGPVPSWVPEPPIKHIDACKCTERFNCNSPGFAYGQCDIGKQYCCYNSQKNGLAGGSIPAQPVHSLENGVLAGPGGPVDPYPGVGPGPIPPGVRPYPGGFGGPGFIPPGGPLGNVGPALFNNRPGPFGQRPINPGQNGVLVGPGGPFDGPYGIFRRNNQRPQSEDDADSDEESDKEEVDRKIHKSGKRSN